MQRTLWTRRDLLKTVPAVAATCALPAVAGTGYPNGPVRLIVGATAGGGSDVIARLFAKAMGPELKTPTIVENRPGGQFVISVDALRNMPADGHTILYIINSYLAVQATQGLFKLEETTVPLAKVAAAYMTLLVPGNSPHSTLPQLIAHARANPGKLTYGTLGPAGMEHLKMGQILKAGGFSGVAVPYKSGPEMTKALLGGEIDLGLSASIFAKMHVPAGKLKALAILEPTRWDQLPQVPTMRELGVQVDPLNYWGAFIARAGTPPAVLEQLRKAIRVAAAQPEVISGIEASGQLVTYADAPELQRLISSDLAWMTAAHKSM